MDETGQSPSHHPGAETRREQEMLAKGFADGMRVIGEHPEHGIFL
jgi:hypothetical protein